MTALLTVEGLRVRYPVPRASFFAPRAYLEAVRDISFQISSGRALGIVGESGSGKTTAAMAAIGLVKAAAGSVHFEGDDLLALSAKEMRQRRRDIQVIFQDPYSSLNPRARVADIVREPLDLMSIGTAQERRDKVEALFALVGLRSDQLPLFPHQFSGGQRQRISIARALASHPKLLICDEPVSALDVAIQAQILNLLAKLKAEFRLSYLFISHDLGVVRHICDDVAVMYLGKIVEMGTVEQIFTAPQHPYTETLLASAPSLQRRKSQGFVRASSNAGDPPSPIAPPAGCAFASRCPHAKAICRDITPEFDGPEFDRRVACHFAKTM